MARMASAGGMLPEQIWDAAPIPARGLLPGRPTGAAMPLVWAHAEYLKLAASRQRGRPFDRPTAVWERYRGERPLLKRAIWTEQAPLAQIPEGCALTNALREPHGPLGLDGRQTRASSRRAPTRWLHLLEIDRRGCAARRLDFTYRNGVTWAGRDFQILVTARPSARARPGPSHWLIRPRCCRCVACATCRRHR
jgi:glucoamylase